MLFLSIEPNVAIFNQPGECWPCHGLPAHELRSQPFSDYRINPFRREFTKVY